MLRIVVLYGIVAGLIVAVPMIALMMTTEPGTEPNMGVLYGYLTMLVALTAVFIGVKRFRDKDLGGVIKFGRALLVGLGISAVASIFYVVGWEISIALTGYDFAAYYSKAMVDAAQAKGVSSEQLQKVAADAEAFVSMYDNPLLRMPMVFIEMFPVGVLISLISAALLRNSRFLPARTLN